MGNHQASNDELSKYQWVWAENHNGLELYRRKPDGLIAERRRIILDHRYPIDTEKHIYKLRENNNDGLVRVYQVDLVEEARTQKRSNLCRCSQSTSLSVYTQRIEYRLSDLPQLTFPESLRVLWQTTNAFQYIYEKFGPFHINGELIGINPESKVKVWVNQNFALNHPSHQIPFIKTITNIDIPPELRNQGEMIHNLLQVVEEKTQAGRFAQPFGENVYGRTTFRQLKKFLSNYIHNEYKDYVPQVIKKSSVMASQKQINNYHHADKPVTIVHAHKRTSSEPINQGVAQSHHQPIGLPVQYTERGNSLIVTPKLLSMDQSKPVSSMIYHPQRFNMGDGKATIGKPLVNFNNSHKPIESGLGSWNQSLNNQTNMNFTSYHPVNMTRPVQSKPIVLQNDYSSNLQAQSSNRSKFKLIDPKVPYTSQSYSPQVMPQNVSANEMRPQLQLQRIKDMLRNDIAEMSNRRQSKMPGGSVQMQ